MKKNNYRFEMAFFAFSVLAISILMFTSCKKKKSDPEPANATYDLNAAPDGKQAGTDSKAAAIFTATYTQDTKKLTYKITFTGIEPASIDIHEGSSLVMGKKLLGLAKNANNKYTSPVEGEITLTEENEKILLKEDPLYINFITPRVNKGEIRGKCTVKRRP